MYRTGGGAFISKPMNLLRRDGNAALYQVELGPFVEEGLLEYYFERIFDGQAGTRGSANEPYSVPITTSFPRIEEVQKR